MESTECKDWKDSSIDSPFYTISPPVFKDKASEILRDYCKLPKDEWIDHVSRIRKKAWQVALYPCVGLWLYLHFDIVLNSEYDEVVFRLKIGGQTLLDIGCGLGQDPRALASDGAPTDKIVAMDLNSGLWDVGFDLFEDRDRMKATFIQADAIEDVEKYRHLRGQIDIIFVADMLHLFSWDKQVVLGTELLLLLKSRPGSLIFGRNVGKEGEPEWRVLGAGAAYLHTTDSIQAMWKEAAIRAKVAIDTKGATVISPYTAQLLKRQITAMGSNALLRNLFSVRLV